MIKPSGGMMYQGVRKEIQTKGIIDDPIHFDALGDMQKFAMMLVSIVTRKAIGPPRPFKVGWHNSSMVQRLGTGKSPPPAGGRSSLFPLVAMSKPFKIVGSTRGLL
nr:hypothetical protein [Tanacetum cinerariifolium]